jgi:hypothetical protein
MTTFLRLIGEADKAAAVDQAVAAVRSGNPDSRVIFVEPTSFKIVPGAPFAYWVAPAILNLFRSFPSLGNESCKIKQGLATADDFRFLRISWEIPGTPAKWSGFAKGGAYSQHYANICLKVNWLKDGAEIKNNFNTNGSVRSNVWMLRDTESMFFLRPGITWPRRTNGLSFRALPAGCIFADKGPAAFVDGDDPQRLLSICAIINSAPFGKLVSVQLARTELAQSFEVGLIQQTPVPDLTHVQRDDLAALARSAWSIQRTLDTTTETSHAFVLPALLLERVGDLDPSRQHAKLDQIRAEIDRRCFDLYGFSEADRAASQGVSISRTGEVSEADTDGVEDEDDTSSEEAPADRWAAVLTWAIGVAFGRFDVRLATGTRPIPPEPEPFDPLPACSPGMLASPDGQPARECPAGYRLDIPWDGILVDDPGHERDLIARIRQVFDLVFGAEAEARWTAAAAALDQTGHELRTWLRSEAFTRHLKNHSKSRRKAPLYWPLSIPSGQYTVWLYAHRVTPDTAFAIRDRVVAPKAEAEALKLARMTADAGPTPSATQRRELEAQELLATELRALRENLTNLAPLLQPFFDDGIVIWSSVLWPLLTSHGPWHKELRGTWLELANGSYDWAQIALRCWPERVIPKCREDPSLAIAHDLEAVFWHQNADSAWKSTQVPATEVERLIRDRQSPAITAARDWLLARSPAGQQSAKTRRPAAPRAPATPRAPRPAPTTAPAPAAELDSALAARILTAIAEHPAGAAKSDIQAALGLDDGTWNRIIAALLEAGSVTRTGEKRGTRYHMAGPA